MTRNDQKVEVSPEELIYQIGELVVTNNILTKKINELKQRLNKDFNTDQKEA